MAVVDGDQDLALGPSRGSSWTRRKGMPAGADVTQTELGRVLQLAPGSFTHPQHLQPETEQCASHNPTSVRHLLLETYDLTALSRSIVRHDGIIEVETNDNRLLKTLFLYAIGD